MIADIELIGFMATFLSSMSVMPQVIKIYRTRDASSVSAITFLTLGMGNVCWNYYSLHSGILPMFISSTFFMVFTFTVLALKFTLWIEKHLPETSLLRQDFSSVFNKYACLGGRLSNRGTSFCPNSG